MTTIASVYRMPTGFSLAALLVPFHAIGRFLIMLAASSSHAQALDRLNQLSDEELAAKGLTRQGEIRRILGASAAI